MADFQDEYGDRFVVRAEYHEVIIESYDTSINDPEVARSVFTPATAREIAAALIAAADEAEKT